MKRRDTKKKEAEARREEYKKMSPEQKLQKLDSKLGKGQGAKKQRERLIKQMAQKGGAKE